MTTAFKQRFTSFLARAALAMSLAASGAATAGVLHVTIDTSTLGAASGYIDMNLSASGGVPLATVDVSHMAGFEGAAVADSWGVTPIAGGYRFRNDTSNDLFQSVSFGGLLSFDLSFAGDVDPLTRYISHFVVAVFDNSYAPLGNYDPVTGALADFSWTPARNAQSSGSIGVTVSDPRVTAVPVPVSVPEPADWLLVAVGLAAMGVVARRRSRRLQPHVSVL